MKVLLPQISFKSRQKFDTALYTNCLYYLEIELSSINVPHDVIDVADGAHSPASSSLRMLTKKEQWNNSWGRQRLL